MNTLVYLSGGWRQLQTWYIYTGTPLAWQTVKSAWVYRAGSWRLVWPNLLTAPSLTHAYCEWDGSKVVAKATWAAADSRAWGVRVELWQGSSLKSTADYAGAGSRSHTFPTSLVDNYSYTIKVYALSQANAYPSETPKTSSFVVPAPVTGLWGQPWYGTLYAYWTASVTTSATNVWLSRTDGGHSGLHSRTAGTNGVSAGGVSGGNTYQLTAYAENPNTLGSRSQGRPVSSSGISVVASPLTFTPNQVQSQRDSKWRGGSTSSYGNGYYYQGYQSGYGTNQGWAWFGTQFYDWLAGATVSNARFKGRRSNAEGGQGNSSAGTIWHYVHNAQNQGQVGLSNPPNAIYGGNASCGKPQLAGDPNGNIEADLGSYGGTYGTELANASQGRRGWAIYDKQTSENNRAVFEGVQYIFYHSG